MSGGGLKLRDVSKLADSRSVFEFEVPVSALPGVPPEFGHDEGSRIRVSVRFGREQGLARADLGLEGRLQTVCQRCMQRMTLPVNAQAAVLVVGSEHEADSAPPGWETFLAAEGRLSLEALAAEELLLALPIVPLHAEAEECAGLQQPETKVAAIDEPAAGAAGSTTRPFADLRELLNSRKGTPDT